MWFFKKKNKEKEVNKSQLLYLRFSKIRMMITVFNKILTISPGLASAISGIPVRILARGIPIIKISIKVTITFMTTRLKNLFIISLPSII